MSTPIRIDTAWFQDRLKDKRISQRAFAKLLGIDHSALSLMLNGKRKMSVAEAGNIAQHLGLPIAEVLQRAGVEVRASDRSIPIRGVVAGGGDLNDSPADRSVTAPTEMGDNAVAARVNAPGTPHHGWVLFYYPAREVQPDAIGRLSIVRTGDRDVIGFVSRGFDEGTFTVTPLHGPAVEDVRLQSATPVRWIRT